MKQPLSGRRALVTGATGGIGREIARALYDRDATVLVSGRRRDAVEQLAGELGARAEAHVADLADADDVDALPERTGPVDILVANAGLPGSGPLDGFSREELDRVIDVNLRAPMQLARAYLPSMRERRFGHLVFINSISGKVAAPGAGAYAATKFGLRGLAATLHQELRGSGVGVSDVFPGFIRDAGMFARSGQELPAGVGTHTPEQVAQAVLRGIETNRLEIDVAPLMLRAGGLLAGAAPTLVATAIRLLGGDRVARGLADAQREDR